MDETIKDLHRDLARNFERHGFRVEELWRSLGQEQRKKIMRVASRDGPILKDPLDTSLGDVYKLIPEWNLRDIISPLSDFLLDILKHRATTPLQELYISGVNGGPGDYEHMVDMMERKNIQLAHASEYKNCYTLFFGEEGYGQSYQITPEGIDKFPVGLMPAIKGELMVPQAIGELVLMRQTYLLQHLNIAIEDILDTASTTRAPKSAPKSLPMLRLQRWLNFRSIHHPRSRSSLT